jgi:hypothetical protein
MFCFSFCFLVFFQRKEGELQNVRRLLLFLLSSSFRTCHCKSNRANTFPVQRGERYCVCPGQLCPVTFLTFFCLFLSSVLFLSYPFLFLPIRISHLPSFFNSSSMCLPVTNQRARLFLKKLGRGTFLRFQILGPCQYYFPFASSSWTLCATILSFPFPPSSPVYKVFLLGPFFSSMYGIIAYLSFHSFFFFFLFPFLYFSLFLPLLPPRSAYARPVGLRFFSVSILLIVVLFGR